MLPTWLRVRRLSGNRDRDRVSDTSSTQMPRPEAMGMMRGKATVIIRFAAAGDTRRNLSTSSNASMPLV